MPSTAARNLEPPPLEFDFKEGEFTKVPIREDDIGAELLPILSKGLYTNPLHAVREYVQNAVDSGANRITIKITGNSVIVTDNGDGMSKTELIHARRFGVSNKNPKEQVGFRGIGIYSGYDLCNRLLITTQQQGAEEATVMEFDFGDMKKHLASDAANGRRTSLANLLTSYTRFTQEAASRGRKGTTVQLEDVSDFHIAQLRDRKRLREYVLRNLPIDFADEFEHRDLIVDRLKKEVPGYHAVKITLESDTDAREVVARPAIPDLDPPMMESITDKDGNAIAFYWACLHKPGKDGKRGQIPREFDAYSGFVYKVKGFTIGDNTKLQRVFKAGSSTLYRWYTGEIYITDPKVIPNTERDDFETNTAYETLQLNVNRTLAGLEKKASKFQSEERAAERYTKIEERLKAIAHEVRAGAYDRPAYYADVNALTGELKTQKSKLSASNKEWGKKVLAEAESLLERIKRDIENPPKGKAQKKASRTRAEETGNDDGERERADSAQAAPRDIVSLVEDAGISLPEPSARLLRLVDQAITAVIGEDTLERLAILAEIQSTLEREW